MVPECPQKAHFEHFRTLDANAPGSLQNLILNILGPWSSVNWPQVAFRMLILSIFEPSVPNDPGDSQKANFEHFRALSAQRPQEAVRSAF